MSPRTPARNEAVTLLLAILSGGCSGAPAVASPTPRQTLENAGPDATITPVSDDAETTAPGVVLDAGTPVVAETPVTPNIVYEAQETQPGADPREPKAVAQGFPALSEDGATVVADVAGNVPMSEYQLAVEFFDVRTGVQRQHVDVVSLADSEALAGDALPAAGVAAIRARVETVRAALVPLHPHTLNRFVASDQPEVHVQGHDTMESTGEGFTVSINAGRLTVQRDSPTGPVLLQRPAPAMSTSVRVCRGVNTQKVRGFYVLAPNKLLVSVGFDGNDSCYGRQDFWQILTIPAGTARH